MEDEDIIFGEAHSLFSGFDNISFSDYVFDQLSTRGRNYFLVDGVSGKCLKYDQLYDEAKRLSAALLYLGLLPGETVAISCENRFEVSSVLLATMFTGTVLAPINPAYGSDEIVHVLNISKPRVIFCSIHSYKNISSAVKHLEGLLYLILFDNIPTKPPTCVLKYDKLILNNPLEKPYQSRDSEVAIILTSSGTTGLPKGVMLSYGNLRCFYSRAANLTLKVSDVILGLVPMYHGYGCGILLASILVGNKMILLPKFEEKLFLSTIEKYKITKLHLVPPLMLFLSKHPLVQQYDLSSVQDIVCGAAPLSREVCGEVRARLPQVDVRQGYGMTETSVAITVTPPHSNKPESVGKLNAGLQVKIVDVETGVTLKRGQQGEILVRGPCVMVGYCRDPESTRQTIDSAGWLHTGDIGYVDGEGFFYIIDRIKELIKYKGYQVAPAELEAVLLGLEGVRDAAVVGLPDVAAGELPIAYVVLQPHSTLSETTIINYVNGKVSSQKRLRGVRFIASIPRNVSGKILRRVLRKSMNSNL